MLTYEWSSNSSSLFERRQDDKSVVLPGYSTHHRGTAVFLFFFWTVFPVLLYVFVPKASGWLFKSPWPRLWLSFLLLLSLPESLSFPYSGGRNLTSNIWIYSLSCARFTKTYRLSIRPRVMKAFTLTEQRGHGGDQITTAFLAIEPAMTNVTVWATCKNVHHLTLQSLTSLL